VFAKERKERTRMFAHGRQTHRNREREYTLTDKKNKKTHRSVSNVVTHTS
jgi:hypothetical protein